MRWAKDDENGDAGVANEGELKEGKKINKNKKNGKSSKSMQKETQNSNPGNQKENKEGKKKETKDDKKGNQVSDGGDTKEPEASIRMKRTMSADCVYVPGSYKEARLKYINRKREKGWSWKEACQKWNGSAVRASWLEGLSTNELKRRRFI